MEFIYLKILPTSGITLRRLTDFIPFHSIHSSYCNRISKKMRGIDTNDDEMFQVNALKLGGARGKYLNIK